MSSMVLYVPAEEAEGAKVESFSGDRPTPFPSVNLHPKVALYQMTPRLYSMRCDGGILYGAVCYLHCCLLSPSFVGCLLNSQMSKIQGPESQNSWREDPVQTIRLESGPSSL